MDPLDSKVRKKIVPVLLPFIFLLAFGLDPLIGAAEDACYVVYRVVQTKAHHSADTLRAWADWNQTHPDYHPAAHRPVRPEALRKFNIACATFDTTPSELLLALTPTELPPFTFNADPTPLVTPFVPRTETPTTVALGPVSVETPLAPSTPAPVPEPTSLLFFATGLLSLALIPVARRRNTRQASLANTPHE